MSRLKNLSGLLVNTPTTDMEIVSEAESINITQSTGWEPVLIPISKIKSAPFQARKYFNPEKIESMTEKFCKYRERGEYPRTVILVRPVADGYELVFGEQRKIAHEKAGFEKLLAFVDANLGDVEAEDLALTENLLREDLNPLEKTEGILNLLKVRLSITVEEVKQLLDKASNEQKKGTNNVIRTEQWQALEAVFSELPGLTPASFRANYLPLLNLPEDILQILRQGKLAYTKARAIASIKDPDQRQQLLEDAIAGDWSLSQIKERIAALRSTPKEEDSQTLSSRADQIAKFLKKKKTLDDPKKQQRLEKLLAEMQTLLFGE